MLVLPDLLCNLKLELSSSSSYYNCDYVFRRSTCTTISVVVVVVMLLSISASEFPNSLHHSFVYLS